MLLNYLVQFCHKFEIETTIELLINSSSTDTTQFELKSPHSGTEISANSLLFSDNHKSLLGMLQVNVLLVILVVTIFGNIFPSQTTIVEDSGISVLTNQNFNEGLRDNEFFLVEFYAPWCGYCQAFAPVFVTTAEVLKKSGSPVKLAKVDATTEIELAWDHDVEGYPTLVFFKRGEPTLYNGDRTTTAIVKWLSQHVH